MRNLILAAVAALSLGAGVANAATPSGNHAPMQQGNSYNFLEGGD